MPATTIIGELAITTIPTGEPWKENCYLVHHQPTAAGVLIDPGGAPELIIQSVLDSGTQLRHILLTHAHHDHVGAVAVVCRRFELVCHLHRGDARLLRHAPMYALRFGGRTIEPPSPVQTYDGEPVFQLGAQPISVMHTPGHTEGSVCLRVGACLFTGDTLLRERVGRTDLPGSDATLLASSVSRLLEVLAGETVILAGHGSVWTVGEASAWWQKVSAAPPTYNQFEL